MAIVEDEKLIRKCSECSKQFEFEKDNWEGHIIFEGKAYHRDCFIAMATRKANKGRYKAKWQEVLNSIDTIEDATTKKVNMTFDKHTILEYIKTHYDIEYMPNSMYTRLSDIYSGAFKGLSHPVPPEDLLGMWEMYQGNLNKIHLRNAAVGKKIEGASRVAYDLSILLSHIGDYKAAKARATAEKTEREMEQKDKVAIDYTAVAAMSKPKKEAHDISNMVDEIFG